MARATSFASLFLLVLGALPAGAAAQSVVSLHAGLNGATLGGDHVFTSLDSRIGFNVGASIAIPVAGDLGLRIGAGYSQKGAAPLSGDILGAVVRLDYVEVPALLRYSILDSGTTGLHLFAGPTLAFGVGCEAAGSVLGFELARSCADLGVPTRSFDVGATGGAGLTLAASGGPVLSMGVFYDYGLTSVVDALGIDARNRAWKVQAGIGIPLR